MSQGSKRFNIYKNKKVLVTGHTGFKGSWLVLWLNKIGADVLGYALEPDTEPSMFKELNLDTKIKSVIGNILDREKLEKTFNEFEPEFVFHLAAQPLVRLSYAEPLLTYETNVIGTLNVLEAARKCRSVKAFVNVTTDKCYENIEQNHAYKEDEPLGGYDMYSSSKACSEILSSSYRRSFLAGTGFSLATARAGNVIGGGDWAKDRIIPDCVRSIVQDMDIELRNPDAVRPWQHVLEPLAGYLLLGEKLYLHGGEYAQSFNFGPDCKGATAVLDVAQMVVEFWGSGKITVNKKDNLHEAALLMLDNKKACDLLGHVALFDSQNAVKMTVEWYKKYFEKKDMYAFSVEQVEQYERKLNGKAVTKSC